MNLITMNGTETMVTSIELTKQINIFRNAEGQKNLEHFNLMAKIREHFSDLITDLKIQAAEYIDAGGNKRSMYQLPIKVAKALLTYESITVAMAVMDYIEKLEAELAKKNDPMLMYEGKSRWDLIMLHAQSEKEKEEALRIAEEKSEKAKIIENVLVANTHTTTTLTTLLTDSDGKKPSNIGKFHNTLIYCDILKYEKIGSTKYFYLHEDQRGFGYVNYEELTKLSRGKGYELMRWTNNGIEFIKEWWNDCGRVIYEQL